MKIIIGNSRTVEMVGDLSRLSERARKGGAWGAQRMLWFAQDSDVVVLPWRPPSYLLEYVTSMTGTDPRSLTILVPPAGALGTDLLTPDRLADPVLISELRAAIVGEDVERVVTCFDDQAVVELCETLGVQEALAGYAFSAQGGVALVNSKAVFRAVATGIGLTIAPGVVTADPARALSTLRRILGQGHPAMIKQEYAGGGFGNTIVAPHDGVRPSGAAEVTVLPDSEAVAEYLGSTWHWMTAGGESRVVIERFFTDCTTVYAEFEVTDAASELSGTGEILMEPVAAGEVVPPPSLRSELHDELVREGRRICDTFRALGYRGRVSADAIATPDGELLFTETNGRVTGSTHLHTVLRDRMLGPQRSDARTLLERDSWPVRSFPAAVAALERSGLAFDRATGEGVVLTANYVDVTGAVMYCAVAATSAAARALESRVLALAVED